MQCLPKTKRITSVLKGATLQPHLHKFIWNSFIPDSEWDACHIQSLRKQFTKCCQALMIIYTQANSLQLIKGLGFTIFQMHFYSRLIWRNTKFFNRELYKPTINFDYIQFETVNQIHYITSGLACVVSAPSSIFLSLWKSDRSLVDCFSSLKGLVTMDVSQVTTHEPDWLTSNALRSGERQTMTAAGECLKVAGK